MSNFVAAHLDDIEEFSDGRCPWRPVRHHFGITSCGVNSWTGLKAGDRVINEHDEADVEDRQEELYFVQSGRARFELDGENVDAPPGTFVHVQPEVTRTAFAEEPGTTIVSVGGTPGKAYQASGWEVWAQLWPLFEAGEYEQVAEHGRELLAEGPAHPMLFYNLACAESMAGRKEEALEHLGLAIEGWDEFRSCAAKDSDFDAIREEPAFEELVRSQG
jgi:hypothetical protein